MRDLFPNSLSSEAWLIRETEWKPEHQGMQETNLALGNGYIGSRAVLEEIPLGSTCGTFFAGVFDSIGAQTSELVNAPNPFDFRITCNGEKLDVAAMNVLEHQRILDMQKGILFRKTLFRNSQRKRFAYQSLRFLSSANTHVGVMRIFLTPLDEVAQFEITTTVDTAVTNMGLVTEGMKRHVVLEEVSTQGRAHYLCVKTLEKETHIAYATHLTVSRGLTHKATLQPQRVFRIQLKKGETACFTKFFSFHVSHHTDPATLKDRSIKVLQQSVRVGLEALLSQHCHTWEDLWKDSDIEVTGDKEAQRAIRFNIYHLLICVTDQGDSAGLGAKALTGEGYRGHAFWDTEIYTLPFYIFTHPSAARHLLHYRYARLHEARKIAIGKGYKGAMFPWESADTGEEVTPSWYKNEAGKIQHIETGNQEHHITADIAYGVWNYFTATGDVKFMLECGLEMMFETARFWASRVEWNPTQQLFAIKNVIGPDEFHENVNNNAFTNRMAKWNLWTAARLAKTLGKGSPGRVRVIKKNIGLTPGELEQWKKIRRSMANASFDRKEELIEQFDGFFQRKNIPVKERNEYGIPLLPQSMSATDLHTTQFVKQADVLLAIYLHPDAFSLRQGLVNYNYYERRTLHKSSLSTAIHAIMGLRVGKEERAYQYCLASLYTDLRDLYKNTYLGIHIASCGGTWQALVHGFGGVQVRRGTLCFNPKLPRPWTAMRFSLKWRGFVIRVDIDKERTRLSFFSRKKSDSIAATVHGARRRLFANTMYSFPRVTRKGTRLYIVPKRDT